MIRNDGMSFAGRCLPPDFDPGVVEDIDRRLAAVATEHGARLLMAIESGSRAWGFPSPDSDYDCRFVYVRPLGHYARLAAPRDVIEFPLEGDLDVNGWDLQKALRLALGGNAVAAEWATSPIRYADPDGFQARFAAVLDEIVEPCRVARHYAGLMYRYRPLEGTQTIPVKKLFYLLRPILSLSWMAARDFRALPPMHFPTVLSDVELDSAAREAIEHLLALKAVTRELGEGPVPPTLQPLLQDGLTLVGKIPRSPGDAREARRRHARAEAFLAAILAEAPA